MWIEVTATDTDGNIVYRSGHLDENGDLMTAATHPGADPDLVLYSDVHRNDDGDAVPFFFATWLDETSLRPLETSNSRFRIKVPERLEGSDLRLRVRVLLRPFDSVATRKHGLAHLIDRLPIWEMSEWESGAVPVVRQVPRRTEYRVPGDFARIDTALDALQDGDTLIVGPGEHLLDRSLDFRGKAVRVVSQWGAQRTVLRMRNDSGSIVVFQSGEGPDSRLEGFTLTGGTGTEVDGLRRGGGIWIASSSPTIVDNRIERCRASDGVGGGICCDGGQPVIRGNEVVHCSADLGGGIALRGSGVGEYLLARNSLEGNKARLGGGLYVEKDCVLRLERCVVAGNAANQQGGGVFAADGARLALDHATVISNRSRRAGAVRPGSDKPIEVSNSVFYGNQPFRLRARFSYSILDRPVSPDSTNANVLPLFVDPGRHLEPGEVVPFGAVTSVEKLPTEVDQTYPPTPTRWMPGDYRPLPGSPMIDGGEPRAPADSDDTRTDVGARFLEQPMRGFVRGDIDGDGIVGQDDLMRLFAYVANDGEPPLPCDDAADFDDGGSVNVADVALLGAFLLGATPAPSAPFPDCGLDPTFGEGLGCQEEPRPCRRDSLTPEQPSPSGY